MKLRPRITRPEFFSSGDLLSLPREIREFYRSLWCCAEDSGCFENHPFEICISLYPSPLDRDITPEKIALWLEKLTQAGKLVPYQTDGKNCFWIKNFHAHQSLNNPYAPSLPLPGWIAFEPFKSNARQGRFILIPDQLPPNVSLTNPLKEEKDKPSNQNRNLTGKEPEPKKNQTPAEPEPKKDQIQPEFEEEPGLASQEEAFFPFGSGRKEYEESCEEELSPQVIKLVYRLEGLPGLDDFNPGSVLKYLGALLREKPKLYDLDLAEELQKIRTWLQPRKEKLKNFNLFLRNWLLRSLESPPPKKRKSEDTHLARCYHNFIN